jgi:syntaxin 8
MSLAKLTSVSTQTLSLLLERQRLHALPAAVSPGAHLQQIVKNLAQLRVGVLELEANEGRTEATKLLRSQFERMRSMLGDEGNVER